MKNSQKGFVVPVIILIAILIGGGVYYYTTQNKGVVENESLILEAENTQVDSLQSNIIKGWLEGTRAPLNLSLRTQSQYTYKLNINDKTVCTVFLSEKSGDSVSFPCIGSNQQSKWGFGDRVRITGTVINDLVDVSLIEVVSSLPIEKW